MGGQRQSEDVVSLALSQAPPHTPTPLECHKNPEHDDKVGTKHGSHLNPDKDTAKSCRIAVIFCQALLKLIVGIFNLTDKSAEMAVSSPDLSLQDVIRCFLCTARGGNVRKQVLFVHTLSPSQWKLLSEFPNDGLRMFSQRFFIS